MNTPLMIISVVVLLAFFVWLMLPSGLPRARGKGRNDDEVLDPSDSRQIGMLIGLIGGSVADAAVAKFALQRFEQFHGRKATTRDIGVIVGLMQEL